MLKLLTHMLDFPESFRLSASRLAPILQRPGHVLEYGFNVVEVSTGFVYMVFIGFAGSLIQVLTQIVGSNTTNC